MGTQAVAQTDARRVGVVVPRWEWRVIDPLPSATIDRLGARRPHGEISHERYLLSPASPHNAKIRRGTLEVKVLLDEAPGGFELWRPAFELHFPLRPESLDALWVALSIAPPAATRPSYGEQELVAELLAATPLRVVHVAKSRTRYAVHGAAAERAFLTVEGSRWETFAIEDADLDRLRAARQSVHTASLTPTNYPAWLKRVVGMPATPTDLTGGSI